VRVTPRGPSGPLCPSPAAPAPSPIDAEALFAHIGAVAADGHLILSEAARERVAARFRALGEPTRLRVLERLFDGPASVNEILEHVGGTQANVSKHLALLHAAGLLSRKKDGTRTVYAISDPTLKRICSIVCTEVERSAKSDADAVLGRPRRR
jgi:DNA-binding transcriptional ArsR family regulator